MRTQILVIYERAPPPRKNLETCLFFFPDFELVRILVTVAHPMPRAREGTNALTPKSTPPPPLNKALLRHIPIRGQLWLPTFNTSFTF